MKKMLSLALAALICLSLLSSCGKPNPDETSSEEIIATDPINSSEEIEAPTESEKLALTASSFDEKTGKYLNPLTGEFTLNKSAYGKRPYAVMISNIKDALPQWGVSEIDIAYEFLAEGGITRIVALFADGEDMPKVGPVRSARTYFIRTAMGYDAIYGHFGASDTGQSLLNSGKVDHLDGMALANCFPRDADRKKTKALEHTAYTTGEKLVEFTNQKKFRTDKADVEYTAFTFNEKNDISVNGVMKQAAKVDINFSTATKSEFLYNQEDKLYYKSEFGKPQMDSNNDTQIAVRNVIVISDKHTNEAVNTICRIIEQKSGEGYYISDGKAVKIKWTKGDQDSPYKYTLEDGSDLLVNPGSTWVSVVQMGIDDRVSFS